jgi:hypothetical protein
MRAHHRDHISGNLAAVVRWGSVLAVIIILAVRFQM